MDAGGFHAPARLRISVEGEHDARREREDVAPHRVELALRDLDQLDAALRQQLDEPRRHQGQMDGRQIAVQRGDQGHQMENLSSAVMVGKVERHHLDAGQRVGESSGAGFVGAVPEPDQERPLVEPERVTALGGRRSLEPGDDRDRRLDEVRGHGRDLPAPSLLAGAEQDRAAVGDDRRVVHVDRIRADTQRRTGHDHFGSRIGQLRPERLVLGLEPAVIGFAAPPVCAPAGDVFARRRPDEHAPERGNHALAAEGYCWGNLHRVETTARLSGLEAGGGCAAKYSAALLDELLAGFAPVSPADLLVGLDPPDDAAVYRLDAERALVLTTDFFPPMLDDPALYGAIAATNALNDVFAMGGRPLVALSIAAFPEELALETVRAVFDAAQAKVAEAGAILAGGHTIRDSEPKYGLAVAGLVHPDAIWRKNGAAPGDALFLTKPLGTGIVVTAARQGLLGDTELAAAADWMTMLNDGAAEALRPFQPSAATDITGFGLFGHAQEIAERSGVRLVLEAARLPALDGALTAASQGIRTGGDERNRRFAGRSVDVGDVPNELAVLGHDPQTAGGLLVSVPAARGAVLEATFRDAGLFLARIGRVEDGVGVMVV